MKLSVWRFLFIFFAIYGACIIDQYHRSLLIARTSGKPAGKSNKNITIVCLEVATYVTCPTSSQGSFPCQ